MGTSLLLLSAWLADRSLVAGRCMRLHMKNTLTHPFLYVSSLSSLLLDHSWTHFITTLPVPKSFTHSVYDIAAEMPDYSGQITLIDTVFLKQDMRRLLPLTAMFAPNSDWENKIIAIEDISKIMLENHLIEDVAWCEDLVAMDGQVITTLNKQVWTVTVNEGGKPCFNAKVPGGESYTSCVVECDILANNGIVHLLDQVMLTETPETLNPKPTAAPTQPPVPCYDVETFETPYETDERHVSYSGIMFDLFSMSSRDILSLEIAVRLDKVTDFNVEIFSTAGGYLSKMNDESAWTLVANASAVPTPDGRGIFIPQRLFSTVSLLPRERISVYIQMSGPWIVNRAQALVKTGELAFDDGDFYSYAGIGTGSRFPTQSETTTDPQFSGKIYYQKEKPCQLTKATTVDLQFLGGPSFGPPEIRTLGNSLKSVVDSHVMEEDWFKERSSTADLKLFGNAQTTNSPYNGDACPWTACSIFTTQLSFMHKASLSPGELRYQFYRYVNSITREVKVLMVTNELNYIGFKSATSGFKITLTGVADDDLSEEREKYLEITFTNFFRGSLEQNSPFATVFATDVNRIDKSVIRYLRLSRHLLGSVEVEGTVFGARSAESDKEELTVQLQNSLQNEEEFLVHALRNGPVVAQPNLPSEAVSSYFNKLVNVTGTFERGRPGDAEWDTSPADLLSDCVKLNSPESVVDCLEYYSHPSCFNEETRANLTTCLTEEWTSTGNRHSDATAICLGPLIDCVLNSSVEDAFAHLPACTAETGIALTQCLVENVDTCAYSCENAAWGSPFESLVMSDILTCSSVTEKLFEPVCGVASCCSPCQAKLGELEECIDDTVLKAAIPDCKLDCASSTDVRRRLEKPSDRSVASSAEEVFARCVSATPGLSEDQDGKAWLDFINCVVKDILESYEEYRAANTEAPTLSPSMPPTPSPTKPVQRYKYNGLSIRMEGAKQLTAESKAAFEKATENFYRSAFVRRDEMRRRLQQFTSFETEVKVISEAPDAAGNTITYDQSIAFQTTGALLDKQATRNLLEAQLISDEGQKEYVELLTEADPAFESVTAVASLPESTPKSPSESGEDSNDSGLTLIITIIAAIVGCCCCGCAAFYFWQKQRDGADVSDKDGFVDEAMVPEQPISNPKEMNGPKEYFGQEDEVFSDEDEAKSEEGFDPDHSSEHSGAS